VKRTSRSGRPARAHELALIVRAHDRAAVPHAHVLQGARRVGRVGAAVRIAVMPSICVVVATLVGALPRRMSPPHLPRVSSTVSALVESVDTEDDDDTVGLKAVKVIGEIEVPGAEIRPPFSTMSAGAPPLSEAGEAKMVVPGSMVSVLPDATNTWSVRTYLYAANQVCELMLPLTWIMSSKACA